MTGIIIYGTTMKERAILEYHNLRYIPLENGYFPIKDIKILSDVEPNSIITMLERPRQISNECAVLIEDINKEFDTIGR